MIHQGFEVNPLLLGGIQRVFFGLQLRLQASQNLQIAAYLCGQFANMLSLELADFFFLVGQASGAPLPIGSREILSCLPIVAGALRGFR